MTTPTLPVDGQTNWGDPLNAGILQVNTNANNAGTALAAHAANTPSDPHGDRAYASSLVSPITSGVNQPNGYVKLNSQGLIPDSLLAGAGGASTNVYDAVAQYNAVPNTGADQSAAIQSALDAAGNAGGGVVWLGVGTFSIASYLVIHSNTTLYLSEGTILKRITGATNPAYMIANVQFGTNNNPGTNIIIMGGKLDAVGSGLTAACTPIFMFQTGQLIIKDMTINNVFNNPAIELNGVAPASIDNINFTGTGSNAIQPTKPAIRLNVSATATTPAGLASGLYNNTITGHVNISGCNFPGIGTNFGPYGSMAAMDLTTGGFTSNFITLTGCVTGYASNNNQPLPATNLFGYATAGCVFSENNSTKDGWKAVQNFQWANSGSGPNFQYRILDNPPRTVEIIGDVNATVWGPDGTVQVATIPVSLANPQVIPLFFPGLQSTNQNTRLFVGTGGSMFLYGMDSGATGSRATFHTFLSLDA